MEGWTWYNQTNYSGGSMILSILYDTMIRADELIQKGQ